MRYQSEQNSLLRVYRMFFFILCSYMTITHLFLNQSGNEIGRKRVGIGSICVRMFKRAVIICGCYDGFIYAYDKVTGADIHRMQGPGKMLLHFDIVNNKVRSLVIYSVVFERIIILNTFLDYWCLQG